MAGPLKFKKGFGREIIVRLTVSHVVLDVGFTGSDVCWIVIYWGVHMVVVLYC